MRIFIISPDIWQLKKEKPFFSIFDETYPRRLIKHFVDDPSLCLGCADKCDHCRDAFRINFSESVVGVLKLPIELPIFADEWEEYLPPRLEEHDLTLAINIHEDLLMELPRIAKESGSRALLVPAEAPKWVSRGSKKRLSELCTNLGLEYAFPKPFCSLQEKERHPFINSFINTFRMGKPKMKFYLHEGEIIKAEVLRSAPCGCTYYVAKNLQGVKVCPDINETFTAKYWHSYPCVASMEMDMELGDTILHKGGYLHYEAVSEALDSVPEEGGY